MRIIFTYDNEYAPEKKVSKTVNKGQDYRQTIHVSGLSLFNDGDYSLLRIRNSHPAWSHVNVVQLWQIRRKSRVLFIMGRQLWNNA